MTGNKDRLYVVLYLRGGVPKMPGKEDMYHWALLVGPKYEKASSTGVKFHAKDLLGPWEFESIEVSTEPDMRQLVRVLIAKVTNSERLGQALRAVPVTSKETDKSWNCISWVREAIEAISDEDEIIGRCQLDWSTVRDATMKYFQEKRDAGRFRDSKYELKRPATCDLIQQRETIV